jgi:hypothetical protein
MKKILLILTLFVGGFLSAQGNGDYVNMTFVKTTPGEDYGTILNEKWKELAQMRADEGTITGWDVWWSLGANAGVLKMRPDYTEMDVEIFSEKNVKARTIVWDQTLVNKGLNFAGNEGETPVAPQVAVMNLMKVGYANAYEYEKAENSLNSGDLGSRLGWGLLKRLDAAGEDVYYDYMTIDFYEDWKTMMSTREATGKISKGLQSILNLRTHQQSVPLWLAIQVRPQE